MTSPERPHAPAGLRRTAEPVPSADPTGVRSEVADLLSTLIRIDTTSGVRAERPAAEWVAARLDEAGIQAQIIEAAPGRASVVCRVEGMDPGLPPLLVHGHLDVVPAVASEWTVHPFSGEIRDGFVWGRGAVDMKNMDAMILTVLKRWAREGRRPRRDLVVAFVADEESGGQQGSHHLVREHPGLLADCREAIGEVGGFSLTLRDDARLYLLQTAEKGVSWLRMRATGVAGHGSMVHADNAVVDLAEAVTRIGRHRFRSEVRPEVAALVEAIGELLGSDLDPADPEGWLPALGGMSRMIEASMRDTVNPTALAAGYQPNVIPSEASATLDARFLPGHGEELLDRIRELAGAGMELTETVAGPAVETTFDGALVDAMAAALRAEDPDGRAVPYLLSGGTDAKAFHSLGIRCFGFVPLRLPPELDFPALFHGVDERVPVESLEFGVRVLDRLLSDY